MRLFGFCGLCLVATIHIHDKVGIMIAHITCLDVGYIFHFVHFDETTDWWSSVSFMYPTDPFVSSEMQISNNNC